jgi:hypothetical protein
VSQLTLREEEESHLTVVEEVHNVSSANAQGPVASAIKTRGSRRPRLSLDEKREIARLYAATSTSTSEICARLPSWTNCFFDVARYNSADSCTECCWCEVCHPQTQNRASGPPPES